MPTLLACLSSGKGTWVEVVKIINSQDWDKVFLITNKFGEENFKPTGNTELILVDPFQNAVTLSEQIKKQLQNKITDFEIALNLISGSGNEHMALLEAVLELGLNFRLVTMNNNQLEIMSMKK